MDIEQTIKLLKKFKKDHGNIEIEVRNIAGDMDYMRYIGIKEYQQKYKTLVLETSDPNM